jgi:TrmH family RNA methyltransferase
MNITSLQNPRVKYIVKLRDDKRTRKDEGLMLVEGYDEIQLALSAGHKPRTLLSSPEIIAAHSHRRATDFRGMNGASRQTTGLSAETLIVSRAVFEKMSYRENPDGWMAIFPIPNTALDNLKLSEMPLVIVAESIEKPGNLGAILRTADAAHVDALLLCDPRVDLWNPNVIRASRGAVFSVPVIEGEKESALGWLKRRNMRVLAATPSGDMLYTDVDLRGPIAIAVGTEDEGLTDFWLSNADVKVKIPMLGKVNSLNVSVSTALIVYEAFRQRNA